ncbi:MAG: efflux RND transporter periplasmic adaptor subunit [Betaproteobacteria bacterium]|nr:efflux RND transporter periplasmic adaptor subunit [Betaproteobacteria bacterium]
MDTRRGSVIWLLVGGAAATTAGNCARMFRWHRRFRGGRTQITRSLALIARSLASTLGASFSAPHQTTFSESGNEKQCARRLKGTNNVFAAGELRRSTKPIMLILSNESRSMSPHEPKIGELQSLSVREGMTVNKGDVLGQIDPTDYELRIQERQAQLRQAEAQWLTAQRNAEANKQLVSRGFISENSSANTISALDAAKAARDAVQFQLEQAIKALADTRLVAPISGVVAERYALPGEKLSPDNRVLSIVSMQKLEAEVAVPTQDLGAVRIGQVVNLQAEGLEHALNAKVLRINPATSANSRNVMVYLGLETPPSSVRVGAFVQGLLPLQTKTQVLAVPFSAVRDLGGRQAVWVVKEGKLQEQVVRTGIRDDRALAPNAALGMVQIVEGLNEGDTVIATSLGLSSTGSAAMKNGVPVLLVKP